MQTLLRVACAALVLFPAGPLAASTAPAPMLTKGPVADPVVRAEPTPSQDAADEGWWGLTPAPSGYHLGGYTGRLGGRLGRDGVLDTGFGQLRLVDGSTGEPLAVENLKYGKGPRLFAEYESSLGDLDVSVVSLGLAQVVDGDERLFLGSQIKLINPTAEPRVVLLGAELMAGDDSPVAGAVPFGSGARFERFENVVRRDGHVLFGWLGPEPDVQVKETVDSARSVAVECVWRLEVPAGGRSFVEVKMLGAPIAEKVSEERYEKKFRQLNYAYQEETLRWQSWARGQFTNIKSSTEAVEHLVYGAIHGLRSFSDATRAELHELTDRPFGHPATDEAIKAEIVGLLHEFNMEELAASHSQVLIDELDERIAGLDDERTLAYLHGLTRALRLANVGPGHERVAKAILALGDPDVVVEPWHDPDIVRRDLVQLVDSVGLDSEGLLTRLAWAKVEPGSPLEHMQECRKALSKRAGAEAWKHYKALLDGAGPNGLGSVSGGDMDGAYSIGMMTLLRAFFLDDHSEQLHLVPGACAGLVTSGAPMDTAFQRTRFGEVSARLYYVSPKAVGSWVVYRPTLWPERVTLTLPDGVKGRKVYGKSYGGSGTLVDPRTLELDVDPTYGRGLQVQVRVTRD